VAEQVQPGASDRQRVVDPELVGLDRCLGVAGVRRPGDVGLEGERAAVIV
jgi:hypothetical protein